jgi:hypothetical protein
VRCANTHRLALQQAILNHELAVAERNKHPLRPVGKYIHDLLDSTQLEAVRIELQLTLRLLEKLKENT